MKRKNYRLLSLLFSIPLILTGCGGGGKGSASDGPTPGGQSSKAPAVTGVTIAEPSETVVLDGTRAALKATVAGDEGVSQKVTWSSSDSNVATVTNGVVNFLKVAEQTKVTITATANDDQSFKDSVEFTVEHSPFDLKNSRGNPDTSLFLDEGSFIVEDPQDIALVFADVHHTRWYVEATITLDSFLETDPYPKFGIMASEREDGMWCYEQSHQFFYYVDSVAAAQSWTAMNVVTEDNDLVNWNWGGLISSATASPAIKKGEAYKIGLMRDGNRFYQFYGKATDVTLGVVGTFEYNSFGENPNYVWVGGWATGATVSDPKWVVGDAVDTMYEVPQGISLKSNEEVLYLGESYKIEVLAEGLWDKSKLTFTSSDETVATVNAQGVVTASAEKVGPVEITVGFQGTELSAKFNLIVTDDKAFKVDLDGKMDDVIWSDLVKQNSYLLKKNDNYYVRIYGAKNSKGLYLFMDYVVAETAACNPNQWWTWENVEFRLADDEKAWSGQYWVSSMNGGSFVSVGSGEKAEEVYYKALELGEDNLYHGAFEMFVPYGDDRVVKDQKTYACFGFAPKSGWHQGYNWYAAIGEDGLNITANGFAHGDKLCSEEHVYGDWIVDTAPTCTNAGSAHRVCAICGHNDTKVLEIVPTAHVFDYEHAEITTPATCIATGICTATCTECGATETTVLPIDYTAHVDTEYPASHNHCHSCGIGSYLTDPAGDAVNHNFGGWDNKSTWYDMGVISGDFTFTFEFNMRGCLGTDSTSGGDNCWRTVLPVLYKDGWESNADTGNRVDHVFRMDWFGWDDGAFTTAANNGAFPDGFNWDICREAYSNMDVTLVIKKVGADVTLDWVWKCNATEGYFLGKTFEYHQGCTLVDGTKVGVALTAEWTTLTFTKASLAR